MSKNEKQKRTMLESIPLVRLLFLIFIKKNPNVTGYELMNLVADFSNNLIILKTGTTYTELRKLEKLGFVSSTMVLTGRKQRKYIISSDGVDFIVNNLVQVKSRINNLLLPLIHLFEKSSDL